MRKTIVVVAICFVAFPLTARANPLAAWVARFTGEYLLGKELDECFYSDGKVKSRELEVRLRMFEEALARGNRDLAKKIGELRAEIEKRPTREEVRRIVLDVLKELEGRIQELEERVRIVELKVRQIEEVFGFIPQVPPSPLLRSSRETGLPKAHPLMVEWVTLLCRSEQNRVEIAHLRQVYKETAPKLAAAIKEEDDIIDLIASLHKKVKLEVIRA